MTDTTAATTPVDSRRPTDAASGSQVFPSPASVPRTRAAAAGNGNSCEGPRAAEAPSRRFLVVMTLAAAATVTVALVYLAVGAIVCSAPLWLPGVLGADGLE